MRYVYRVLARLGIEGPGWDGLQALESSLGSGAFIGHGPPPESGIRWTGIELEPLAGARLPVVDQAQPVQPRDRALASLTSWVVDTNDASTVSAIVDASLSVESAPR